MSNKYIHKQDQIIIRKALAGLIDAGYHVTVKGDVPSEPLIYGSTDVDEIMEVLGMMGSDYLMVDCDDRKKHLPAGWVLLIYGNDPGEVIADYTTNLIEHLEDVEEYAQRVLAGEFD